MRRVMALACEDANVDGRVVRHLQPLFVLDEDSLYALLELANVLPQSSIHVGVLP